MSTKTVSFLFFLFIGFTLLNGFAESVWFDSSSLTIVNIFVNPQVLDQTDVLGISFGALTAPVGIMVALFNTLTFNYSFLTGILMLLRLVFMCFTVGFIWGCVQLIRGV